MTIYPVNFIWRKVDIVDPSDGTIRAVKVMMPSPRYANLASRQYADDEEYTLDEVEERSMASHKQFFAALKSGYDNLPERVAFLMKDGKFEVDEVGNKILRWPTVTHYRKWLLIETGHYEEKHFPESSPIHARRLAVWIRTEDVYARVFVRGSDVVIQRAKSQAFLAMRKKEEFEASKRDVLALNDELSGVASGTHMREAGAHA